MENNFNRGRAYYRKARKNAIRNRSRFARGFKMFDFGSDASYLVPMSCYKHPGQYAKSRPLSGVNIDKLLGLPTYKDRRVAEFTASSMADALELGLLA